MKFNRRDTVVLIAVGDQERAKLDVAVAIGHKIIFADYAAKGIGNTEEFYVALSD